MVNPTLPQRAKMLVLIFAAPPTSWSSEELPKPKLASGKGHIVRHGYIVAGSVEQQVAVLISRLSLIFNLVEGVVHTNT